MFTARKKIQKENNAEPDQIELEVAKALHELEANTPDLKADLRELYIVSAKEVDVNNKQAIIVFVPFPLLKKTHKIQSRIIRELEKKFSGKQVVIIGNRKIVQKKSRSNRKKRQSRPRSRTLTAVHEAILDDIVYPTEITGKRRARASTAPRSSRSSLTRRTRPT